MIIKKIILCARLMCMTNVLSKDVKKDNCVKHFRTQRIKMKKIKR